MPDRKFSMLYVDDNSSVTTQVREYINGIDANWEINFNNVSKFSNLTLELQQNDYDLLFTEYEIGGSTAFDVMDVIENINWEKPIILITADGSEKIAARALRRGFTDYRIRRDLSSNMLKNTIERALKEYLESNREKERQRKLRRAASEDEVTGLMNRRNLRARIESMIETSRRNNTEMSLLIIGLKNFNQINAIHGQKKGDKVLNQIGQFLADNVREDHRVGRYQGVEFCIAMPETSKKNAAMFAKRLLRDFESHLSEIDDEYNVEVGYGAVVVERQSRETDVDEMIKRGGQKLYEAKIDVESDNLVIA